MNSFLGLALLLFWHLQVKAENFYSPLPCPVEENSLSVENSSSTTQSFWFQDLGSTPFYETHMTVKAKGQRTLPLKDYLPSTATAIALKTQNSALSFKSHCQSTQKVWTIEAQNSPWKKLTLSQPNPKLEILFANLSQQDNTVEVILENFWGPLHTVPVVLDEGFSKKSLKMTLPSRVTSVKFRAQGRWSGKVFNSQGEELPLEDEVATLGSISPQVRYFLFRSVDPETLESFIVPMTNPKLIQESLSQIKNPNQARLLVARIDKSLQGINRDLSSLTKSPWSWQVVEAQNYADFAHISCDGTPLLVEERLNSWLRETGGTICFWGYRVSKELSPGEVKLLPLLSPLVRPSLRHRH